MKKILILLLSCLMIFSFMTACSNNETQDPVTGQTEGDANQIQEDEELPELTEPSVDLIWVGTWASAQYYGDNSGDGGKKSALDISKTLPNSTLRQIIRTSSGGEQLRLTFSNEYGQTPLTINAAHIAKAVVFAESDIDVSTDTPVLFNGSASVTIPAGEFITSDTVDFAVDALERIAVSIYFGEMPEVVSSHIASRANSFVEAEDAVSNEKIVGAKNTHWFVLCNVDILSAPGAASIVAFGDSITDGFGVSNEQYTRWVDVLMTNLQGNPKTSHLSVINMGIGTNTLLNQKNPAAGIDRFERDVLNQPGVGYLVFLIGVNDINASRSAEMLIEAYDKIITAANEQGIKVYGGTVSPQSKSNDGSRLAVNEWLREQYAEGKMHGLADFDELLKDPDNPNSMQQIYKNDDLHPGAAGYAAMGEYVYSLILADME